eukprot:1483750-Rhodomonas_salina.5
MLPRAAPSSESKSLNVKPPFAPPTLPPPKKTKKIADISAEVPEMRVSQYRRCGRACVGAYVLSTFDPSGDPCASWGPCSAIISALSAA